MSSVIYGLCAIVALLCAGLLLSAWRRQQHRLLLWSGLCFAGFTLNNVLLVLDKLMLPDTDRHHMPPARFHTLSDAERDLVIEELRK